MQQYERNQSSLEKKRNNSFSLAVIFKIGSVYKSLGKK
jgi:hypothetical protein